MAAVAFRLRTEFRSRWRSWIALALLTGVAAGVVLATAAAARRTGDAVSDALRFAGAADVYISTGGVTASSLDPARLEALPGVAATASYVTVFEWGKTDAGVPIAYSDQRPVAVLAPTDDRTERRSTRFGSSPDARRTQVGPIRP
jgi:hypothetical protein